MKADTDEAAGAETAERPVGWENAWQEGRTGWDAGGPVPSLLDWARRGNLRPVRRTLVPGCGAGYDAMLLAEYSESVVGLDIAPTGIERFQEVRRQAGFNKAHVDAVCTDFFSYAPAAPFDRIWDYTFLCAIPMERRGDWARQMARLLHPEGELLVLIFPQKWVRGDDDRTMPPFRLMPEEVQALLEDRFECTALEPVPPTLSHPGREGIESLSRWTLKPLATTKDRVRRG